MEKLANFVLIFLTLTSMGSAGGQCEYNVVVDQCSDQEQVEDVASCCSHMEMQFLQMKMIVNGIGKKIDGIEHHLNITTGITDFSGMDFSNATNFEKDLLKAIALKEDKIKSTNSELEQVISEIEAIDSYAANLAEEANTSQSEMDHIAVARRDTMDLLAKEVANKTRDVNTCKGQLGLIQGLTHPVQNPNDPVNLTYCSFEAPDTTCGFVQDRTEDVDWIQGHGSISTTTGPREDHSYGSPTGHYMYLNAKLGVTQKQESHFARMTSIALQPAPNYCILFWYNMNGVDMKTLNIYAKVGNGRGYPVWSTHGNQKEEWHLAEIELDSEYTGTPFHIVFEGNHEAYSYRDSRTRLYVQRNYNADMAIDDVYFYNTTCKTIPACPQDAIMRQDNSSASCYTFHTQPLNWYKSSLACREAGATSHLVSVNSQEEQDFIVDAIKKDSVLSKTGENGWFTSGNDERSEHHFDWTDSGTPYVSAYSDWHAGQPNNVGDDQNCLLLQYSDSNYEWGDIDCDEAHPFICEVDLPSS